MTKKIVFVQVFYAIFKLRNVFRFNMQNNGIEWQWQVCRSTYPPPKDREGLSTGLTHQTGAGGVGGRVCGVSCSGSETKRARTCPKTWLLPSHGSGTHHLIQQTTAWCPHGRGPRLHRKQKTLKTYKDNDLLKSFSNLWACIKSRSHDSIHNTDLAIQYSHDILNKAKTELKLYFFRKYYLSRIQKVVC